MYSAFFATFVQSLTISPEVTRWPEELRGDLDRMIELEKGGHEVTPEEARLWPRSGGGGAQALQM